MTVDHLIMFNREQYGLHHLSNGAPSRQKCNTQTKDKKGVYVDRRSHLRAVCDRNRESAQFGEREAVIEEHMKNGQYKHAILSRSEEDSIRIIAESIYTSVKRKLKSHSIFMRA